MNREFSEILEASPIIGAVKSMEGLEKCLTSEVGVVFILFGDICNIKEIVDRVKDAGKCAVVHMDLIVGLSAKEITVDFIKKTTRADGIISTKQALIRRAKELGLYTVQRFFVIDSMAYDNIKRQIGVTRPDVIEILPGLMPKVIREVARMSNVPVIAGGLIGDREDVVGMLGAGALAISTTNVSVWFM